MEVRPEAEGCVCLCEADPNPSIHLQWRTGRHCRSNRLLCRPRLPLPSCRLLQGVYPFKMALKAESLSCFWILPTVGAGFREGDSSARATAHFWPQTVGPVDFLVHQAVPVSLLHLSHNHSHSKGSSYIYTL